MDSKISGSGWGFPEPGHLALELAYCLIPPLRGTMFLLQLVEQGDYLAIDLDTIGRNWVRVDGTPLL